MEGKRISRENKKITALTKERKTIYKHHNKTKFIRLGKSNKPQRIKKDNSTPKRNPNYMYKMATLPGDPREDLNATLGHNDVCRLEENGMLCMNLLDFILHSTCIHYTNVNEINYCLGETITRLCSLGGRGGYYILYLVFILFILLPGFALFMELTGLCNIRVSVSFSGYCEHVFGFSMLFAFLFGHSLILFFKSNHWYLFSKLCI